MKLCAASRGSTSSLIERAREHFSLEALRKKEPGLSDKSGWVLLGVNLDLATVSEELYKQKCNDFRASYIERVEDFTRRSVGYYVSFLDERFERFGKTLVPFRVSGHPVAGYDGDYYFIGEHANKQPVYMNKNQHYVFRFKESWAIQPVPPSDEWRANSFATGDDPVTAQGWVDGMTVAWLPRD
ncbi:MAG: hypothetical protein AAF682_25030 [Planctomycetota bacterium]